MKKLALIAMTAAAAIASPATAQIVSGNITLTGTVGAKCFVVPGSGSTFSDAVDFLALDAADGTLRPGLATEFATKSFTVKCTSGNPTVAVSRTLLATGATAPAGYDNSIDYNAIVTVDTAAGGSASFDTDAATVPAATGQIGGPLANTTGNVKVTTADYKTGAATDLLVAGTYNGAIAITITPTT